MKGMSDPDLRDMTGRVEVREDPKMTALLPDIRAARVEVTLTERRTLTAREDAAPGGFDNPYNQRSLRTSSGRLAGLTLPEDRIEDLATDCTGLADLPRVDHLTRLLR